MDLKEMWEKGFVPVENDLYGLFDVKILSGIFTAQNLMYRQWKKKIRNLGGRNIQDGKDCGYFKIIKNESNYILDYKVSQNAWPWNCLLDMIKQVTPDLFVGKISFYILGKYRECGFFSLTRSKTKETEQ